MSSKLELFETAGGTKYLDAYIFVPSNTMQEEQHLLKTIRITIDIEETLTNTKTCISMTIVSLSKY